MSSSGGTAQVSSACRFQSGRSIRSTPSRCSASNKNTDSGTAGPASELAARDEVSWNGSGRPSARSAISSPSSTAARTGSLPRTATTSGSRPVMSSRVRVNSRTEPPDRWAWIRIPSSFHSTAACTPATDLGQRFGDARRAGREHRAHRPPDLQPEGRQRRAAARQRRGRHRAQRAAQHHRPAHVRDRHRRGPGDRVGHHPLQRALPQLAGQQPEQESLFALGGPAEQLTDQRLARGRRTLPGHRPDRRERRVHLGQSQRGDRRGRNPSRSTAQPTPICRCGSSPDRYATAIGTSSGPASRSAAGQHVDLGQPGAGRGHGLRHLGDLSEQHPPIVPDRSPPERG